MQNSNLPVGIDEGYQPVWDEFNRMVAVSQLRGFADESCVSECFRLLLAQTGARCKARMKTDDYVTFKPGMTRIRTWFRKYALQRNLKVKKHTKSIRYEASDLICVALNPTLEGTVIFTCGPFGIKYVLNSLDNRAWRSRPMQLSELDYLGKPKRFQPVSKLKPKDYHCIFEEDGFEVHMARLETELVLKYRITPTKAVPTYKSLDRDLNRLKQAAVIGVFQ